MTDDLLQRVEAELDRRLNALQSFRAFLQWMSNSAHPDFAHGWEPHHQLIADLLQRVADGEVTKAIIQVPPGSAKTTLAIQWRAWIASRNVDHQFIGVSATQNLVASIVRRVRAALQTEE
jgi:hypothetical protein